MTGVVAELAAGSLAAFSAPAKSIGKFMPRLNSARFLADLMDALKDILNVEIQEWDKAAEALKSKSDHDLGQLIVKDLRNLSRFERSSQ